MNSRLVSTILAQNKQREELTLSPEACPSSRGIRLTPETHDKNQDDIRSSFTRDTDRIIHSPSYTRYIDKTQVFYLFQNDNITHRVLHVQLVSKIARQIGRALKLNEDLIEAIALGHDLGHVPYGHDGERILNALCEEQNIGYFSHNGQSVRTLKELENNGRGLNLTIQVLDGILCHNGELLEDIYIPEKNKSAEKVLEEYQNCFTHKGSSSTLRPMTLEGCVVRVSDVIAYIGRDIEDAITIGMLKREEIPPAIQAVLGDRNDRIIRTLSFDLIEQSYGKKGLNFSLDIQKALQDLLQFNYKKIYLNPEKKSEDHKIEKMFRYLYQAFCKELISRDENSFIYKWAYLKMKPTYIEETAPERIAVDYIASMTDRYFNEDFRRRVIPANFGFKV
ncbi:HD domain-containing protein [Oceanispirochaeta sp.]|uniref:deoxyguanosinetriphosphate triphosphohydrolase family protein n=1 Tax=Oceanispirochaeta sp. TaxID=2035350 RepID=UPI00261AF350|nr:HD domain-containing protein [Oceanispirochaeta sp.]MDA3956318.1 HD domain-containing protein [Oceanispirochaeta sp.]